MIPGIVVQVVFGLCGLFLLALLCYQGTRLIRLVFMDASDARHDKRTANSMVGRRLVLAAEDETDDELLEVKEAVDRGDLIQGRYAKVCYGCFDAYCDGRLGAVCDSCKSLLGVTA